MSEDAEGLRRRWAAWAAQVMGGDEDAAAEAARAAIDAVDAGASDAVAAVLGRMARRAPTEADVAMLEQELGRVRRARLALPTQALSESELERQRLFLARLDRLLAEALGQARRHLRPEPASPFPLDLAAHMALGAVLVVVSVVLAAQHAGVAAVLGVACLSLAHALYARRWSLSWAPALCVGLAMLTVGRWFGLGSTSIGIELVGLGALLTAIAAVVPAARAQLWPTTAVILLIVATLVPDMLWAHIAMLMAAAALAGLMAVQASRPLWLVLAMLLGVAAAYWATRFWLPASSADPLAVAGTLLWPIPLAVGLIGVGVRELSGRRWAVPAYGLAGVLAVAHLAVGLRGTPMAQWTVQLAAYAALAYAVSVRERWIALAVPALAAISIAPLGVTSTLGTGPSLLPVSYSVLAILITLGQLTGLRNGHAWRELHVAAGMVVAGCTTLACLASPPFWQGGSAMPLVATLPPATAAGLLLVESRISRHRFLWYPAVLVLSLGTLWVARFAGATSLEWYVLGPCIVLVALAVRATHDPDLPVHPLGLCRACAALGCLLPLAVTFWLALHRDAGLYSIVLAGQSAACVAAGLWVGNRALIVCGLVGSAATLLRALAFLGLLLPPSAAAAVAVLLLTIAMIVIVLTRHAFLEHAWARLARAWERGV